MRKLSLFFVLILAVSVLAACSDSLSGDSLSHSMKKDIETAYLEEYRLPIYWCSGPDDIFGACYYGIYEGYTIIFQPGQLQAEWTMVIADELFYYPCQANLYAYKDGKLLKLEDIYHTGLISK